MTPPADPARYKNHRFPGEIISHGVWLYYRFPLSYRDVQELLFERGIDITHEAIRQWCLKFGQAYANQLKHRRPRPSDKWHLDEVFLTINGQRHYLWRAVDQDDHVLDIPHSTELRGGAPTAFLILLQLFSLTPILGHPLPRPPDLRMTHAKHLPPEPRKPYHHCWFSRRSYLLPRAWKTARRLSNVSSPFSWPLASNSSTKPPVVGADV
jgi:DDE superfamily endonuclease